MTHHPILDADEKLLDLFPFPVTKINTDYRFIYMNPTAQKLNGITPHLINHRRCYEVLGNGNICPGCSVAKAFDSKQVEKSKKYDYTPDHRFVLLEQTAIPILAEDGTVDYVLEVDMDTTPLLRLKQEIETDHIQTIFAFARLIEARDRYTGKHSENVGSIAVLLGQALSLPAKTLDELSTAAILHDIGKIGVPESVLMKPGKLSPGERREIERHPLIGFEALSQVSHMESIAYAILHHHERMDGKGYPHGIAGEAIPLIARILSVADVFEALTAHRIYRSALPLKEVLSIMEEGRKSQFDPVVLDCLFTLIREGKLADFISRNSYSA